MSFLNIAFKDLRIRIKDRNNLVLAILLPVALTAIIGFAFGSDSGISTVEFTLVEPDDESAFLVRAAAALLSQVELFEVDVAPEAEARESVLAGDRSAAVALPDSVLSSVFHGTPGVIRVLRNPVSGIKAGIVRSVAERFATYVSAGSIAARGIVDALERERELSDGDRLELYGWMFGWMRDLWDTPVVSLEGSDQNVRKMDAVSYFAPSFAVLFLLFTMLASARTIHDERESGTYDRLMTTPVSPASVIGGKLLGCYWLAAFQLLVLIGLGALLFRIDWGSHPTAVVVMALVTAAGATSVAIFIAAAARTSAQTDRIGTVVVLVMSLVGGSMWPLPESFDRFGRFTFNYWAQSGFRDLVFRDTGLPGIAQEITVIGLMSLVLFAVSVRLLARRS